MFRWLHVDCIKTADLLYDKTLRLEKECEGLKNQLPTLLGQIKEQKAILEYAMHEKEQHIESLQAQIDELRKDNSEYMEANNELTKENELLVRKNHAHVGTVIETNKEHERLIRLNTDLQNKLDNLINKGKRLTAEFKDLHKDKIDPTLPDNEYREALDKELSWQRTPDDDELDEINQTGCGPTLSEVFESGLFKNIKIVAKEPKHKTKTKRKKK